MALAVSRDADEVLAGFGAWLTEREPGAAPELLGYDRPTVGFSSETYLIDVRRTGPGGISDERLVVKLPPLGPAGFPAYDFAMQARVQEVVAAAGIPAPAPSVVELDERWVGAPFLVMPATCGHVIDQLPLRDHWLTKVDPALATTAHERYLDTIAAINRVDWRSAGLDEIVPARDNTAELAHWRSYLEWYADGADLIPALTEALDWCDSNRPPTEPEPSLLWGDVRLGNIVYDEQRAPAAVLDWEMASIGAAEHDIAWTLALDATQDELFGRSVPGFLDTDAALARYERQLGRPVQDRAWYEIFAMVRSIAIMSRIGYLHEQAGEPGPFPLADNPLIGFLERRIERAGATTGSDQ